MKVAVIKYNAGNIRSVSFALNRLNIEHTITDQKETIMAADRVIFPGVGEARSTMEYLRYHKLDQVIVSLKQPVLGICLGMQLLCSHSEENDTPCLGIFNETVKLFKPTANEKVPHIGWNSIMPESGSWLDAFLSNSYLYFVHSYYVPVNSLTSARTNYIQDFSAAMKKNNFFAVQFHPEKSALAGEQILMKFFNS